ncbi:MAG: ArsA family ATPase [Pseudomonadota bacterium]
MTEILFFIGKGGVGKSTTSAVSALRLAAGGRKTCLVSMDPAHNLSDIFETRFSETPCRVTPHLRVSEIDAERWSAKYLKETREQIRKTYLYETAFGLEGHFKVLQYSPGIEEYALLTAFEHVLKQVDDADVLIVDMAPTAVALRFFSLPFTTLAWVDQLLKLRELICRKKEIISRIQVGNMTSERDRIKAKLQSLVIRYTRLRDLFCTDTVQIQLVMNPDRLSLAEARRIHARLADFGIRVARIIVNKVTSDAPLNGIAREFSQLPIARMPAAPSDLIGLPALQAYISRHPTAFTDARVPATATGTSARADCRHHTG